MSRRSRGWLVAALVVAVGLLGGSIAAVAAGVGRSSATFWQGPGVSDGAGPGPGMMGGYGPGGTWMTGGRYGLAGDGQPVTTMAAARPRSLSTPPPVR